MAGAPRFEPTTFEYGAGTALGVDPVLDGTSLRDLVSRFEHARPWEPAGSYAPLIVEAADAVEVFLGRDPEEDGLTALLGCVCGTTSCWPLEASVVVTDDHVTWTGFTQPFRENWSYDGFGPFVFARDAYEAALRDLVDRL